MLVRSIWFPAASLTIASFSTPPVLTLYDPGDPHITWNTLEFGVSKPGNVSAIIPLTPGVNALEFDLHIAFSPSAGGSENTQWDWVVAEYGPTSAMNSTFTINSGTNGDIVAADPGNDVAKCATSRRIPLVTYANTLMNLRVTRTLISDVYSVGLIGIDVRLYR